MKVRILVFSGYGLNCEEETAHGFRLAGGKADIVHINDVIGGEVSLASYQILCFPGGFSYGDNTGSGKAYANRVKNHLGKELEQFLSEGKLILGICNGFQILTQLSLLPGALTFNESNRYTDRWVDLVPVGKNESPWLKGIEKLSLPIGHGEGKYVAEANELVELNKKNSIALRYAKGDTAEYQDLPANPNGSTQDIAGVLSHEGRVFGLMPHPDRAFFATQLPHWPILKERARRGSEEFPTEGPGMQIFRNGIQYFSNP